MNPKGSQDFQVIISHPARQGNIYERPLTAQRHGIPVKLLTGLYYKPEQFPYSLVKYLPSSRRALLISQLEKRRLLELNPESVISLGGPWLEVAFRPFSLYETWWMSHDWLASLWIKRQSQFSGPTLLHCFDGAAKRTIHAARARGIITVLEITFPIVVADLFGKECMHQGVSARIPWSGKWVNRILEEYRAADYLIAQSRVTVNHLLQLGIAAERIILLPLGVDTNRFRPVLSKDTCRPFRALFVGQLGIRKGLHHLLEAWKQLELPNAELILVGSVNKHQLGVELLKKYNGIYRWLGFVDARLPEIYQNSDIFVLPSLAEGGANAMHEAMASGLPCIVSTNVGCTLTDGVEGFVIQVGDVEALKDRIRCLYSNPLLRRRMARAARARAEQLNWQEYGRRLILAYNHILAGHQAVTTKILAHVGSGEAATKSSVKWDHFTSDPTWAKILDMTENTLQMCIECQV
jgi:glycosyltransferase involved in cell wall biosynthesis